MHSWMALPGFTEACMPASKAAYLQSLNALQVGHETRGINDSDARIQYCQIIQGWVFLTPCLINLHLKGLCDLQVRNVRTGS